MKRFLRLRRNGDEAGYVAIMISIMVPTLFIGLAAIGVDTARWYVEGENVQIAADAAALAGVPFLPQDLPGARTRALQVAARNGYVPGPDVTIVVEKGIRDSQLRVTINSTIPNQFGGAIGVDSATIGRTAVADFTGPAPMGSPCNTFGTEPASGTGAAAPAGSAIGASRPPNCPQEPQMWATLEGPQTGKVQGDRYGTANCESNGVDGCDASRNNQEYLEEGYFFLIKVQAGAVNRPISLQLYDPAFVLTGQFCDDLPDWKASPGNNDLKDNMNPYATTDGRLRYSDQSSVPAASRPGLGGRPSFCPGDSYPGSASGGTNRLTTTYMVREQTDSQDPLQAAVVNSTAGTPCAKQFGSYTSTPTVTSLREKNNDGTNNSNYNANLAQVFHNWVELCTFTPTRQGDYYLHVRTNKRFDFTGSALMRSVTSGSLSGITGQAGDSSPYGGGSNSFAIRAVTPAGIERQVAVSGYDRMPIYVNSEAADTEFNLIRILPGAAGQFISFDFFDAGDATSEATVQVLLPADATKNDGTPITDKFPTRCRSYGGSAGGSAASPGQTSSTCTFTLTRSGSTSRNNGKVQTITIPIPPDYKCDATDFVKCWYKVKVGFSSGSVHDVTTWDAEIVGDPVRLIE